MLDPSSGWSWSPYRVFSRCVFSPLTFYYWWWYTTKQWFTPLFSFSYLQVFLLLYYLIILLSFSSPESSFSSHWYTRPPSFFIYIILSVWLYDFPLLFVFLFSLSFTCVTYTTATTSSTTHSTSTVLIICALFSWSSKSALSLGRVRRSWMILYCYIITILLPYLMITT